MVLASAAASSRLPAVAALAVAVAAAPAFCANETASEPLRLTQNASTSLRVSAIFCASAAAALPFFATRFADPHFGEFANDPSLSKKDIDTIVAWADSGASEGEPRDLPAAPKFVDGWQFGKPDVVIDIGQDFEVPAGSDLYKDFIVPTNFKEGRWIRAAQVLAGNRKLVHHAHVYISGGATPEANRGAKGNAGVLGKFADVEDGLSRVRADAPVVNDGCADNGLPDLSGFEEGSLATLLPGKPPDVFDVFGDGSTAKYIPAGATMRFQVHYAKVSQPGIDRTSIGLYFAPNAPAKPLKRVDLRNRFFVIPPGAADHRVTRCYDLEQDKLLIAITPHMHYRGKDSTYELVHADSRRETLLVVPHYNFNWQLQYRFKKPVVMEKGSRIIATFHYDNSANNPSNPDSAKAIRWGTEARTR